jgi:hypothetical protein
LVLAVRLVPQDGRGRPEYVDLASAALLGGAVLCVLLSLVQAESGGIAGLWWLFLAAPALAAAFVAWESRIVRRRREPQRVVDPVPGGEQRRRGRRFLHRRHGVVGGLGRQQLSRTRSASWA